MRIKIPALLAAMAVATPAAKAVQIRDYLPETHDRFIGFPDTPAINPGSFFDGTRLRGVGWRADQNQWQFALVTRSHVVAATHALPPSGSEIRFLNANGQIISRLVSSRTFVSNQDGTPSDLTLVTLDQPIDASEGVIPFPYLDEGHRGIGVIRDLTKAFSPYVGKEILALGKFARAGTGTIDGFDELTGSSLNPTAVFRFDYDLDTGGANDARLESGDSGSPSFHPLDDGRLALVGIHSSVSTEDTVQSNFDAFIPSYVEEMDLLLAPAGYRMTPVNTGAATIDVSHSVLTPTPRKGNPLSIDIELANPGQTDTGNLEWRFQFPEGSQPDGIAGEGWVSDGDGTNPTLRRALLEGGSATTLTLTWEAAPIAESVGFEVLWNSDKSDPGSLVIDIPLADSFNAWAVGLEQPGQTDNPDKDSLINLLEYALGSDPENGRNVLADGVPATPLLVRDPGVMSLIFPQRIDAASRGLSYTVEWSETLEPGSWSSAVPSGWTLSTTPYSPAIQGFVKTTFSGPIHGQKRYFRLNVSLNE